MFLKAFVKKLSLFAAAIMLMLTLCTVCASAESDVRVYDYAGIILSVEDMSALNAEALNASGTVDFYIATTKDYLDGETFLKKNELSDRSDIFLLIITLDGGTYFYDIYEYGLAAENITQSENDEILDASEVYNNLKSGKILPGVKAMFALVNEAFVHQEPIPWGTIILVALIIGVVAGGITTGIVIGKYKMKMRPTNYPLNKYASMKLTGSLDQFVGSHVTVTRVSSSSGGGGGGGSSHGGGGGHGGGR